MFKYPKFLEFRQNYFFLFSLLAAIGSEMFNFTKNPILSQSFQSVFRSFLPDLPTSDQQDLIDRMGRFLDWKVEKTAFIIRGYAGTGKTTSVGALVKTLPHFGWKSVLMAPTGRAAKVLSAFSGKTAFTIHRKIYQVKRGRSGEMKLMRSKNLHSNTIFIVDEASMISDLVGLSGNSVYNQTSLLDDLVEYVYNEKNCKLIFIGDTAQLPPVGMDLSPALDPAALKAAYGMNLKGVELKSVLRQSEGSGILHNATKLRINLAKGLHEVKFDLNSFCDIEAITGAELEDKLQECYSRYGEEQTLIISRSNKRANIFNQQIRARIKFQESEVSTGDYLMIVKNNYFWLEGESEAGFIANGDIAEIESVKNTEEIYGFRFADVNLRLVNYDKQPTLDVKILLDSIMSEYPSLSPEENQQLFDKVMEDYIDIPDRRKKFKELKKNPYFNALQVKFANAVTCHKAQGGQWSAVFVDQGYLSQEMLDVEFSRWLYTALTRATEKLYLVNFNELFFD